MNVHYSDTDMQIEELELLVDRIIERRLTGEGDVEEAPLTYGASEPETDVHGHDGSPPAVSLPMPVTSIAELQRLRAAEEAVWGFILLMHFGGLDIPMAERKFIQESGMEQWVDLAVETGIMKEADND